MNRGKSGEITIFLSMILLCVSGLLCVMLESARTAGARWYLQMASGSSIDSLFSQYHRQLWQKYHLLGLEYESEEEMAQRIQGFLNPYLEAENWYPMKEKEIKIRDMTGLTDGGGLWLETQVLDYMKYGIWTQLDIRPEDGERLWKDIRESVSMESVIHACEKQSDAAWELEQTLDRIYQCLEKQRTYHKQASEALLQENSHGFYNKAKKLEQELGRIPGLITVYEKQAEGLLKNLLEMEQEYEQKREELRPDMSLALKQELEIYSSYVREDSERRQQIVKLKEIGEVNQAMIDEVRNQVNGIEEYLSSLEPEEEDHSQELWNQAQARWGQFLDSGMRVQGQKQEEKRGWLTQIQKMAVGGLLELTVPLEREISTAAFDLSLLPSAGKGGGETDGKNLMNRVLVNEYCAMHFTDFVGEGAGEAGKKLEGQRYQMEYLLGGKDSDRDNLAETVKKLLVIREGMNLMYLLSDSQKREEARVLALAITGALGLTPLVEITTLFILSIWALGEAIVDIQSLMEGGKIPLIKKKGEWHLNLEQLLEMGKTGTRADRKKGESGLSYSGYLKLILLAEESEQKYYRMMDVIQMELQKQQPGFQIGRCAYGVDMEAMVCGKHVFFSLPLVEKFVGKEEHEYWIGVKVYKSY